MRTPEIHIDLTALARNYELFSEATEGETGAVVKANAYGLGMHEVVVKLDECGCCELFVATIDEAAELIPRTQSSVYLFGTFNDRDHLREISDLNVIPVLHDFEQIRSWHQISDKPCALFFNTGMNRLGLKLDRIDSNFVKEKLNVQLLMTHLACADEPDHPMNDVQMKSFDFVRQEFCDIPTSIGNSAAILNKVRYQGDITRPGIGLYGGNPYVTLPNPMSVVATCIAPLVASYDVKKGEAIGYGSTYVTDRDIHVGVIGMGYADGVPRQDGAKLAFVFEGKTFPVVGRVSMDFVTIDMSSNPSLPVGTAFEWFGGHQSVDLVARDAQTISYEIFTGLGSRVTRIYYA